MPGIVIIDGEDRVTHSNARAAELLRDVGDAEWHPTDVSSLPIALSSLIPQLKRRLRDRSDTTAAALLTVDLCVRACRIQAPEGPVMMLLLERVQRRDAVAKNIERFSLTPRECDVVMLLLYGHSNRRIADQLFLTEYTVEDHLKRVFAKIGVKSRTALAAKLFGWREPD
jgi:DNA-binding CsgD family transcriptional regulator